METIPQHEEEPEPLGRDICFTPEQAALRALVDQLFNRVDKYADRGRENE